MDIQEFKKLIVNKVCDRIILYLEERKSTIRSMHLSDTTKTLIINNLKDDEITNIIEKVRSEYTK